MALLPSVSLLLAEGRRAFNPARGAMGDTFLPLKSKGRGVEAPDRGAERRPDPQRHRHQRAIVHVAGHHNGNGRMITMAGVQVQAIAMAPYEKEENKKNPEEDFGEEQGGMHNHHFLCRLVSPQPPQKEQPGEEGKHHRKDSFRKSLHIVEFEVSLMIGVTQRSSCFDGKIDGEFY
uniref:Uncharacterized protein n=1 Tax=Aegilops tauschii TaxID=37682 RepID=R7WDR7_AEGTA